MSQFQFNPSSVPAAPSSGGVRSAFASWLHVNHSSQRLTALRAQRARITANHPLRQELAAASPSTPTARPLVGIVGGGFAGLYAGMLLQSLGIECELFESTDRVGGRISTWYSKDYDPRNPEKAGLYGEVGGMRVPQFSDDMLPVQQLSIAVNAVLERSGLDDLKVIWRKFYYSSDWQRMRFNNMREPIIAKDAQLNTLNFGVSSGGSIAEVWLTPITDPNGHDGAQILPINAILGMVNGPFLTAINLSFADGFALLMQYDQYSMWDYLTTVFTLGDLGPYYDPAMGARTENLPFSVASFLETTNVGSGMYSVSFVEMVIAVYDWGGSKDPYRPDDPSIYMLTVDHGMQRFPDACRAVLNLERGVTEAEGNLAQIHVGMIADPTTGAYSYTASNLSGDAQPHGPHGVPPPSPSPSPSPPPKEPARRKQRVFLEHKVTQLKFDAHLFDGHGGMRVTVNDVGATGGSTVTKEYPYVITTLPNGAYLNGEFGIDLLNDISLEKATAIRESDYMPAFKAFLTFRTQFWAQFDKRQPGVNHPGGIGAASTDRPNRQIIYPSYGYQAKQGVLQVYCWAQDARRLGALSDEQRVAECLKGIQHLYPEVDFGLEFLPYNDGVTTKTWFWDEKAGGGAFALFNPGQFKNLYGALQTPEFGGSLNFAGECASVHHGWILGALDSAYNAVYNIVSQAGTPAQIKQLRDTWGEFTAPDIATNEVTANVMDYAYLYNQVDREAASVMPKATGSIYGDSTYVFTGNVPAFIKDYERVPASMQETAVDQAVLALLNAQWDANVASRIKAPPVVVPTNGTAVAQLEAIYYGNNFQTIPAPRFWLKDDDEFARQQLAGFMPTLLTAVSQTQLGSILTAAGIPANRMSGVSYVADYRRDLEACTIVPTGFYLPKPMVFFTVDAQNQLLPVGIQLEPQGELFTPTMPNAENAWLLAKMLTNCAGQTLHDVGFHQLLTHQICAMVSIALFSGDVFRPGASPEAGPAFQEHPVFKLLRPHVVKAVQFQQSIYNSTYDPYYQPFPATRVPEGGHGVYNIGFVYDLIFSCGRIGNYQLQDKIYNDGGKFRFLDLAVVKDAERRGVKSTPFSYPYVADTTHWYRAIEIFVGRFVDVCYAGDPAVASDAQLQRFFAKLIPAFNYVDGKSQAQRFPASVTTKPLLTEVLTMFVWQFSVQHTVINDGAYNMAAFVPNASTLMYAPPSLPSSTWTPQDVLRCLPSNEHLYDSLGKMNFMDVQINASVTGQGPYPSTILGRGMLEPSINFLQDTYGFIQPEMRAVVDQFFHEVRKVGEAIELRQAKDVARYVTQNPACTAVPDTVVFDLVTPRKVMNTIQT